MLAERLGVRDDWQDVLSRAINTPPIPSQLNSVRLLPAGSSEGVIQGRFADICKIWQLL